MDILTRKPPDPDVRVSYGSDPNQFIDVRLPRPSGQHPVVFFIHGGYWRARYDLSYAGNLCSALAHAGIATWNIEYRRVGNAGGGWPGSFEDVRNAYHMLYSGKHEVAEQIDLNRVCVAGHSAGGHLALCLAAFEKSVTRVFSLAGVVDLRRAWELHLSNDAVVEFLGGSPAQVPEHYREASPMENRIAGLQKLVHGTADDSVPYEISQRYAEIKRKSGEQVELITLKDIGHFEIVDPESTVWPEMQKIFISLVQHPPGLKSL
jgi:acetyl esterase/lipase